MYAKCGSLDDARQVFAEMRERNLFAWSAMINGCSREHRWEEVIDLFAEMMWEGVILDKLLFPKILQACANTGDLKTGMLLHSLAVRGGFLNSPVEAQVGNAILAMYAKCGIFGAAKKFFRKMAVKDLVSWNSIISAHCQCGEHEQAFRLFERMKDEGIEPSVVTWNILISSYNHLGHTDEAMQLMKQMESSGVVPDVFTWTCLISGFVQNNRINEALDLFIDMQNAGVEPNEMTIACVISACASLKCLRKGRELHSYAIKRDSATSVLVGNALVDMYAKCGSLDNAERVFDAIRGKDVFTWNTMIGGYAQFGSCGKAYELFCKMEDSGVQRNVITWNVMISGYIQNKAEDQAMELFHRMEREGIRSNTASWNALIAGTLGNGNLDKALNIFRQMQSVSVKPNSVTILSILPACANLVSGWKVKEIHASLLHSGLDSDLAISNCLIDTYSKSGDLGSALMVFNGISSRDLISCNSMISGCIMHGCPQLAQNLFNKIKKEGIKPNHAILARIIDAYAISGMVNEGKEFYSRMFEEYELSLTMEHYAAIVHLYGRSGRLREAAEIIEKMPMEPDSTVWHALLTAARVHGNIKLASLAAEHLIKIYPRSYRIRRLLLHIQALSGRTSEGLKALKPIPEINNVDHSYGSCCLVVKHNVYTFLTGAKPKNSLELSEEEEEVTGAHSEQLAIVFTLKNVPSFQKIRIIKSIRMCAACHSAAKLISRSHRNEILLKDPGCLHRFKDENYYLRLLKFRYHQHENELCLEAVTMYLTSVTCIYNLNLFILKTLTAQTN
ncbi:pentatricopeptide repeat-containing protein At1g19720-like [Dioscorea cayenensis subsp. rotundata]|uniref:Pentatricopeptide repeat-containing protein At1g19720-like n=1 Tax=Dioscorea cayennensis subsp. rotundata TaxID=55577 RepID=A0AB40CXW0_DIOCR|nr:pentatricopeptide repeat-containing protein At1g19720-like [Dioscorea cayenensis subsp. rotundata]